MKSSAIEDLLQNLRHETARLLCFKKAPFSEMRTNITTASVQRKQNPNCSKRTRTKSLSNCQEISLTNRRTIIVLQGPTRFDCLNKGNFPYGLGERSKEISSHDKVSRLVVDLFSKAAQCSFLSEKIAPTAFPFLKIPPFSRKGNRMRLQDPIGRWIRMAISTGVSRHRALVRLGTPGVVVCKFASLLLRFSGLLRFHSLLTPSALLSIGPVASFNSSSVVSMFMPAQGPRRCSEILSQPQQ